MLILKGFIKFVDDLERPILKFKSCCGSDDPFKRFPADMCSDNDILKLLV